jgi:quinol monooxygenase YgiN
MAVVERYFGEPNDLEEFLSLHREIYDQHLRKAGASDMTVWQDRSNWRLYVAEVRFENFAALDNWEAYFKTEEGKDISARVNAAAQIIERLQYSSVDY